MRSHCGLGEPVCNKLRVISGHLRGFVRQSGDFYSFCFIFTEVTITSYSSSVEDRAPLRCVTLYLPILPQNLTLGPSQPPPARLDSRKPLHCRKLTKLTLLFPACGCQVGQFLVFLRELDFAVAEAGPSGEALLGEAPVAHEHRLSVHLELLKLKELKCSVRKSNFFFLD